jgi:hypothetical protein
MTGVNAMLDWIARNRQWLFDGIGVTVLAIVWRLARRSLGKQNGARDGAINISVSPTISPTFSQSNMQTPQAASVNQPSSVQLVPTARPRIVFSRIPPAGAGSSSRGNVSGWVVGVSAPETFKIVLYAQTDIWYVQPLISGPYTNVGSDGGWENWTHLGDRYAALLVRLPFRPAPMADQLPEVGGT